VLSGAALPEFSDRYRVLERLRKRLDLTAGDDFFVVCGPEEDCLTAAEEIRIRFADATQGVPRETRQALSGGFTTFERILPGPDRMYPDTDSPPTRVTAERVAAIRARLRPAPWHRLERYLAARVPEETGNFLIRRGGAEILDAVVERTGADLLLAAVEIGQRAKAMKRGGIPVERLGVAEWVQVFDLFTGGRIPREGIGVVATAMARDGLDAESAARAAGIALEPRERWLPDLERLLAESPFAGDATDPGDDGETARRLRHAAGRAVRALRGRAPAREVAEALRSRILEVAR